ncbi:MAG: hypothetical protein ACI9W2_003383 [Gammaproteobacteria bacterium]|jgi:hypothetical protein
MQAPIQWNVRRSTGFLRCEFAIEQGWTYSTATAYTRRIECERFDPVQSVRLSLGLSGDRSAPRFRIESPGAHLAPIRNVSFGVDDVQPLR